MEKTPVASLQRLSFCFLLCALLLCAIGLLMVFNTTSAEVLDLALQKSTHHAFVRQIFYAFLGGMGAALIWFLGYETVLKLTPFLFVLGVIGLLLVFVPGIGMQINGAKRWIGIGPFSMQPSEFMKIILPLYFIHRIGGEGRSLKAKEFFSYLALMVVPLVLIIIEPDNGTVLIMFATLVTLFLLARVKMIYWALPLALIFGGGVVAAMNMKHVSARIEVYLHPESDIQGKGHQPYQAKIAAGSGGLWGRGFGESLQKMSYLPEARSDYIAAIYAEENGFAGMLVLTSLYMCLGYCGFRLASQTLDRSSFLVVSIVTFLLSFQAFLNLGVVSGLLPSKGTNLPLFSHGGTSLIVNLLSVFLILNVAKKTQRKYAS